MKAHIGDMIVIKGHTVDEPNRTGEILDVKGTDGEPPYIVRWDDDCDAHQHFFFPGPDAEIRPLGHQSVTR